jgi:hypothetical protein
MLPIYCCTTYVAANKNYETHLSMHVKCKIFLPEMDFKVTNMKFHRNPSGGSRADTCGKKVGHNKGAFCLYVNAPKTVHPSNLVREQY